MSTMHVDGYTKRSAPVHTDEIFVRSSKLADDHYLYSLAVSCAPTLHSLSLAGCLGVTDIGIAHIAR